MKLALPQINLEKCTGCGDCIKLCPTGVVNVENGKVIVTNAEKCNYCTECETFCTAGAIKCPFEIVIINEQN